MPNVRLRKSQGGFTLIELMIVVTMIGVFSTIAIPTFLQYQARARRGEAFANLSAISRAQKGFYAEKGVYFEVAPFPNPGGGGANLGTAVQIWDAAAEAAYAELGWTPDGQVRYSYDINTGSTGCDCDENCFTATAYGDVDGDDSLSAVMYVQPLVNPTTGAVLVECPSHLFGFGTPLNRSSLQPVYSEVAVNFGTDEY